jgi:uncharacterized membrane protein YfcA
MLYLMLVFAGFVAGAQNALAGGGSFLTFPALLLFGMGARAANITSTVALFPGQVLTGWAGRTQVAGLPGLGLRPLMGISLAGGGAGAVLLLATPESFFQHLVPFLVLFATVLFAWGSFMRRPADGKPHIGPRWAAGAQAVVAVYGGYFGGGVSMLMLALLTLAGQQLRVAGATKNVLNAVLNISAVAVFALSPDVHWPGALAVGAGALAGGQVGAWALLRVNERALRIGIVGIGFLLAAAMFWRGYGPL